MDGANLIRSMIFLVPGLLLILVPEKVNRFQNGLLGMLRIKRHIECDRKASLHAGIVFIVISAGLFVYAIR